MEPPTPLRNADFRSLLTSTPRPVIKPTATPSHPSSTPHPASTHPPAPPKSTKRLEHYQRYLAKQAARQQQKAPEGDADGAPRGRHGYRDRARERRLDDNPDYDDSAAASTALLSEEASKFLGGDEQHTHLVKGLDFALVRRKREEEERRQQEKLDQLLTSLPPSSASTPASSSALLTPSSASSHAPDFRSSMARAVYDFVVPLPIAPSNLFLPGRLSYSVALPPPSPFALLPLALAAPALRSAALLSQLNQLPVSVLAAKDDLVAEADRVSGFVPPSALRQLRVIMERKRERKRRKKQSSHASTAAQMEEGKVGSEDEGEGDERKQPQPRPLSVEERRKQLMAVDDDDIFGDAPQAAAQPTGDAATAAAPPLLPSSAVFKPAAPTSRYFETPSTLSVVAPLPTVDDSITAAPLPTSASSASPPPPAHPAPSTSLPMMHDEYDELYPDAAISFSGAFAGDEDSDDEANAVSDKKAAREEKMQAKRGGRRHRGLGGEAVEQKREEKRREAKIDSQLAGVTELLKKDSGKLRLQAFEREGAALEAAKRLKLG